ncbi:ricin B lectin [Phragmitibacter flavus]|uniref:Ricin B lectin n=1 Tax=Phragmitibacter flavus TaxID=2576071 RepID=A0A5R8KAR3_9BACT|nr:RICIN domain-containing protein [Phragmitibacter flavus]TLD68629.1 ricin B lectin [Phragmitibacter flavus]
MHKPIKNWLASLMLPMIALGLPQAQAYTHPSIPFTIEDLDTIKANLDKEPWKSGYAALAGASTSQLNWPMEGPTANVSRTPDINLTTWKNDMNAIYNLARMWYFTGNHAYAQKAHGILLAWANNHTSFSGQEMSLSVGDFAPVYIGGADILRGTWPGWTEADTTTVKNYFRNVYWPQTLGDFTTTGPANKGYLNLAAGIAIAAFLDDTEKFNRIVDIFRTTPAAGLPNTLPIGVMGETGRDAGHLYGGIFSAAFFAEVAWKQGIDLYSELDNRLLACGEYYARNTYKSDNPFVPFGTIDWNYYANNAYPYTANRGAFFLLQNAYKNRLRLPTPWIDHKMIEQGVDGGNFMYAKAADFSTATPLSPVVRPPVSPASGGLTLTTLGGQTAGRSLSYASGVWTMSGLGGGTWTDGADDCQFAYRPMTGDCAMVAKVTSATWSGNGNGKVGLMIRDNLVGTVAQRHWVGIVPNPANILMEAHVRGWTEIWGGNNRSARSAGLPPGIPYWVKIERRGNLVTSYTSQDGVSWGPWLAGYFANLPATINMGLFICSGNSNVTTATFEHVAYTGGTGGLVTTPAAPAGLLSIGSNKAITVRWLQSYGATAYDLLRSTTSGSGYTVIAGNLGTDKTSYVDKAVAAGTTYYYVVRAKNSVGTSANSPQFSGSLWPVPMSNLALGGGTASDSGNSVATNSANAFDNNPGSLWFHQGATGWVQFDFGAGNAQVIKRYTVSASPVIILPRDPKNWQFQASNDGTTWTTLDIQTNQAFPIRMQQNTYNLSNTTAYRYHRFNVTANNGDAGLLHLGDVGLWSDVGRTIPDGRYHIVSRLSNKVMDAAAAANGTPLVQWGHNGFNGQKWDITHVGNGQYRVTNAASGKVMDVAGASSANGTPLHLWDWLNGNNQKWTFTAAGDGYWKLIAVHSGKSGDLTGGSTANGASIIQWQYSGNENQHWLVAPTP